MGAVSGMSAVAFMLCAGALFRHGLLRLSSLPLPVFAAGSLAVIVFSTLAVGLLLGRLSPGSAGSGIPEVKVSFWKDLGFVGLRHVLVKFAAGVLSIGGGTSLGREGPTVFIGGGVASGMAGLMGVPKQGRRRPVLMGAAAALAAAFNTPLAAMTFVLEEILNDLNSRYLGSIILSAVIGAFVVHATLGRQPAFEMPDIQGTTWRVYAILPVVSIAAAYVACVFQRSVLSWRKRIRSRSRVPLVLRPMVGGLVTWALGIGIFAATGKLGVFGLGYGDLSDALTGRFGPWQIAGLLVLAKVVASVASYSWGGCGGIFSPTLFLGGLTGLFVSGAVTSLVPMGPGDTVLLCACGMCACFGAAVRAPFTSVLIVFEMTHQFSIVPALMLTTLVSQAVASRLDRRNLYDALLEQDGHDLGHTFHAHAQAPWKDIPVTAIASSHTVTVTSMTREAVKEILNWHPFARFPVADGGRVKGVARRAELEAFAAGGARPRLLDAVFCPPGASVHEAAQMLVDSPSGMLLLGTSGDSVEGIVTLHDLIRAQVAVND